MSGKPYPEGVAEIIRLLDIVAACESEMSTLKVSVEKGRKRLEDLGEQKRIAWSGYSTLMRNMDVSSEGNYGFEGRAGWFLAEMRRQVAGKAGAK